MFVSNHALRRAQQRGVRKKDMERVVEFGTPINRPGHAVEYLVTKKVAKQQIEYYKEMIKIIERIQGKSVITLGNTIITTYHKKIV